MKQLNILTEWMTERHAIYLRRKMGLSRENWTDDSILKTYRFCNVFRELDAVTKWIDANVRKPYADHPNLWFLLCLCRQINWPPTIQEILKRSGLPDVWDPAKVRDIIRELQAEGRKVYTSAYMLRCDIQKEASTPNDKATYTCFRVLDPVWRGYDNLGSSPDNAGDPLSSTLQSATEWLEQFHGWGGFLSYEVACDLRHTRYLREAPDIYTWANPGPGAYRGLNRVFDRPLKQTVSRSQAIAEMQELLEDCRRELPPWVRQDTENMLSAPGVIPLEMRDIEHSLCEVDKYQRVLHHQGQLKSLYKPEPNRAW